MMANNHPSSAPIIAMATQNVFCRPTVTASSTATNTVTTTTPSSVMMITTTTATTTTVTKITNRNTGAFATRSGGFVSLACPAVSRQVRHGSKRSRSIYCHGGEYRRVRTLSPTSKAQLVRSKIAKLLPVTESQQLPTVPVDDVEDMDIDEDDVDDGNINNNNNNRPVEMPSFGMSHMFQNNEKNEEEIVFESEPQEQQQQRGVPTPTVQWRYRHYWTSAQYNNGDSGDNDDDDEQEEENDDDDNNDVFVNRNNNPFPFSTTTAPSWSPSPTEGANNEPSSSTEETYTFLDYHPRGDHDGDENHYNEEEGFEYDDDHQEAIVVTIGGITCIGWKQIFHFATEVLTHLAGGAIAGQTIVSIIGTFGQSMMGRITAFVGSSCAFFVGMYKFMVVLIGIVLFASFLSILLTPPSTRRRSRTRRG